MEVGSGMSETEACYAAEDQSGLPETSMRFQTQRDGQNFLFDMLIDPRLHRAFPKVPEDIDLMFTNNQSNSWAAEDGRIRLGAGGKNVYTLLHEFSHLVSGQEADHGPLFRYNVLKLVAMFMTISDYAGLQFSFKAASLSINPFHIA
jgi:hypothetical protein